MNAENFAQRKRDVQVRMIHDWSICSLTVVVAAAAVVVIIIYCCCSSYCRRFFFSFLFLNASLAKNSVEIIDCMPPLQDTNAVVISGALPGCTTLVQKRSLTGVKGPLAEWSARWKPTRPVSACVRWVRS